MLLYCRELLFNKKPMGALYIYPIFLNLAIERGKSYFEHAGRFCLVAMRMVKHLDDVVALHTLQVKGVIGSRGCVARKHVYGQVMTGNFVFAYDESVLDGIHHLTHIDEITVLVASVKPTPNAISSVQPVKATDR